MGAGTRQVGLNGVDNGAIRFTHVKVPRENLLDRFASVDRSGGCIPSAPHLIAGLPLAAITPFTLYRMCEM